MFHRTNLLIVLIAIAGALAGFFAGGWLRHPSAPAAPNPHALRIGDVVPPAERPDLDGRPHALAEWKGKLLMVNFWASWCGPCREEMPLLDRAQERLAGKGVQIVGIAFDTPAATRDFLGETPVGYPILIDDPSGNQDLSALLGNDRSVLPYTVLIGRDGRLLAERAGSFSEASLDAWLRPHL
jgi:thiol-disulfide isomerase/thioredoxin